MDMCCCCSLFVCISGCVCGCGKSLSFRHHQAWWMCAESTRTLTFWGRHDAAVKGEHGDLLSFIAL